MANKTPIKTGDRKTSVTREAVRKAIYTTVKAGKGKFGTDAAGSKGNSLLPGATNGERR